MNSHLSLVLMSIKSYSQTYLEDLLIKNSTMTQILWFKCWKELLSLEAQRKRELQGLSTILFLSRHILFKQIYS